MTAIRIYWWNGGPGHGNFGDSLGPMICEQLAKRPVRHASLQEADLISIGNILEPRFWGNHLNRTYQGCIWGAGRMFGNVRFRLPLADIRADRGELTRKTLSPSQQRSAVSGEPGLLAPLLPATVAEPRKRYKVGVIPHWTEVAHPKIRWLAQLSAEVLVIDPTEHVNTIIDRIRSCDSILSSAMHGLVVADSFGIPNHCSRSAGNRVSKTSLKHSRLFSRSPESQWSRYRGV
ncbi:MAG: polysaccharide pyruvyl transferase family protein [Planctomycetia bacterium]|nr:polysaccharide pyruvyl transferase family protein [Planctomycetia bacterium]